jgi:hypothetical protein
LEEEEDIQFLAKLLLLNVLGAAAANRAFQDDATLSWLLARPALRKIPQGELNRAHVFGDAMKRFLVQIFPTLDTPARFGPEMD